MEQDNNEIEKSEKMEEKRTRVVRARANCLSYPVVPIGKEAKEQLMLLLERIFFQDHVWKFIEPDNGKRKTILTGFFIPKWTKYIIK